MSDNAPTPMNPTVTAAVDVRNGSNSVITLPNLNISEAAPAPARPSFASLDMQVDGKAVVPTASEKIAVEAYAQHVSTPNINDTSRELMAALAPKGQPISLLSAEQTDRGTAAKVDYTLHAEDDDSAPMPLSPRTQLSVGAGVRDGSLLYTDANAVYGKLTHELSSTQSITLAAGRILDAGVPGAFAAVSYTSPKLQAAVERYFLPSTRDNDGEQTNQLLNAQLDGDINWQPNDKTTLYARFTTAGASNNMQEAAIGGERTVSENDARRISLFVEARKNKTKPFPDVPDAPDAPDLLDVPNMPNVQHVNVSVTGGVRVKFGRGE